MLHFVSDRSGWWNIYRYEDGRARKLTDKNAELVNRSGYWGLVLTHSRPGKLIACSYVERGEWKIAMLHIESGMLLAIDTPFSEMGRGDIKAGDGKGRFRRRSTVSSTNIGPV
ncbi:MAG: hypothetical protein Ct9H300mP11_25410 [Chloroflexota bacterium]|nr:MAG: hypothetical protein Ct9H300mP11_25410 [Chloroflexota bacterium]